MKKRTITALVAAAMLFAFAAPALTASAENKEDKFTLSVDFSGMDPTADGGTLNVDDIDAFAIENVKIAEFNSEGNILAAKENKKPSYVIYRIDASEGMTISSLMLRSYASVNDFYLDDVGSYAGNVFGIYVSDTETFDFENGAPVISGMVGKMNHRWDLSAAAKGLETAYVAVYFINNSDFVDWIRFYTFEFDVVSGSGSPGSDEIPGAVLPPIDYSETILRIDTKIQEALLTADPSVAEDPSAFGAFYSHNVIVNDDGSRNCITPVNGMFTSDYDLNPDMTYDGGSDKIRYGVLAETQSVHNPYVCFRLCADRDRTIESLVLNMRYYLRKGNNCYYQIGIWVTDTFAIDDNGAYDFTASDYALLLTSTDEADVNALAEKETIDLSEAVKALNSREVYVIMLLNRGYGAEDATRLRIRELTIEAEQSGSAAASESGESGDEQTTASGTEKTPSTEPAGQGKFDPVPVILITAGALIAVVAVVTLIAVFRKKKN